MNKFKNIIFKNSLILLSYELYSHIRKERKKQIIFLVILMLFSAFAEVINLTIIIPFITLLSDHEKLWDILLIKDIAEFFNISSTLDLITLITIIFIFSIVISATIRLITLFFSNRLSAAIGSDLSCSGFAKIINQPYEKHLNETSSEIIVALTGSINKTVNYIRYCLQLLTSILIILGLSISIFLIDKEIFLISITLISSTYLIIMLLTKQKLDKYSKKIKTGSIKLIQSTQESLGSIINIKLDNTNENFIYRYKSIEIPLRKKIANSNFLSQFPKYLLEAIFISLLIIFSYISSIQNDDINVIQKVGILAFAAQKILPEFQKVFASWAQMRANKASAKQVIEVMNRPSNKITIYGNLRSYKPKNSISFQNVSYAYPNQTSTIKNINLDISIGEKIGIKGKTGSGKSTFLNLFMGILRPSSGELLIDNINPFSQNDDLLFLSRFQLSISYVPQNFFIIDGSLIDNVAYGINPKDYNIEKAVWALEVSQLKDLIDKSSSGFNLQVGERGINLSGGQKQRLIIARALYKQPDILILDEATSALDEITESKVLAELKKLSTTNLFVSHRLSNLKSCDRIIQINNGRIS
ncbi:ABC transporter ATP-binding protein/permease [Prochlorococcus sp. AH-736-E15]|nr:ABC transporter ATP-binding protein/permease [Prochlorococcus sp. AH-736-E15]